MPNRPLRIDYDGLDEFLEDYELNLSEGRATVHADRQLEEGQRLDLALTFPALRKPLCLRARVRRRMESASGDGRYELDLELPGDGHEQLAATVRRIARRDPALYIPRRLRIMVVEDNRHVAELIQRGLEGHLRRTKRPLAVEVELAENGAKALERIGQASFGLLLVDICLPVMAGDALISKLRQEEQHAALPIIALSAAEDAEAQALSAGANLFLHKPIRLVELLEAISQLVPSLDI